ncbi:MAG: magnesium/cobalt transporter CorA [Candidatus Cloacimonetes bacterium]|nr:magnesium/cobalt transporter CorA [Candidatus Cloacimonadota bacterium]
MSKHFRNIGSKAGMVPGTLIHIGERTTEKIKITRFVYNDKIMEEDILEEHQDFLPDERENAVTWINLNAIHEPELIGKIGESLDLHLLTLEDILNTGQRPKMEDFEEYIYIVIKMLTFNETESQVDVEQISVILGKNYVISFQEKEGDVFDEIRDRIRLNKGKIRKKGPDYLLYTMLDAIVDNYFLLLEKFGEKLEFMEENLVLKPEPETLREIYKQKRELIYLRKSIWPLRELISNLDKYHSTLIKKDTYIYLRDVYDHSYQVQETVETFRDMVSGMLDIYLSSVSNKMNEIMKILTIFAAIFIPLTFLAGVYGMNFKYLPELNWKWAYPVWWGISLLLISGMLFYFRRKNWL